MSMKNRRARPNCLNQERADGASRSSDTVGFRVGLVQRLSHAVKASASFRPFLLSAHLASFQIQFFLMGTKWLLQLRLNI